MRPTNVHCLRFFKDRLIPEMRKSPQGRRNRLTTKNGNKDFYKGTGSANMGWHTKHGKYIIDYHKVRTYVVPEGLSTTKLAPYVSLRLPEVHNEFKGYKFGAYDGKLYIDKYKEYLIYGADESPQSRRKENWVERG
ncbi:mitochondrial 54S ribosomal protein mL41 [Lipomyces chichibuensis]|uniref:mitochondrial 54S ribosomal protein mL41 n=1 Tax=Lipomyces chichibuensis TaxID=1546026 RepID=UPI003343807F